MYYETVKLTTEDGMGLCNERQVQEGRGRARMYGFLQMECTEVIYLTEHFKQTVNHDGSDHRQNHQNVGHILSQLSAEAVILIVS